MAKYYRRRIYKRVKAKTWSSRIQNLDITQSVQPSTNFFIFRNLATNPVQSADSVSNKFTVKNIWVNFTVENLLVGNNLVENLQAFVMFIPQGFTLSEDTPYEHPEWIMASKHIGIPLDQNSPGYSPLSIRTRLARKLDTGDKVVFVLLGSNTGTGTGGNASIRLTGIIRYNTKAN